MQTMDIRIKMTADIIKECDRFSESVEPEKADNEFQLTKSSADITTIVKDKYNILSKAKIFKKKFLARMSSLAVS